MPQKLNAGKGPDNHRTYLDGGVFNKVEYLGTDAMGGGHGDMRNAGGLHAKIRANAGIKKQTANVGMSFDDFVKQDAATKMGEAEKAKKPDAKKVKQMVGPNKLAPMVDTGGGRMARMVVAVRARPLSRKEASKGASDCLIIENGGEVFANDPDDKMGGLDYLRLDKTKDKHYMYDHAFGPESTSEDVYNKTMLGVVSAVMQGYHGSCFAYGATGSGKTFTMAGTQEAPGVMPRAISDLFKIAKKKDEFNWRFTMTYVEIYNERIKDLLNPNSAELDVRECPKRGNIVAGAVEVGVSSLHHVMELMSKGTLYRTTEATNCNEASSRSHAVMQINCIGVDKYKDPRKRGAADNAQAARLSMIDLAGSERAYKTDNTGQRLREGRMINRSLLSLANCINALADKTKKVSHVPYRDSKLTRLLRDSLSGTSVSAMICAVSPSSDQFEETLNTLKYAHRAKEMSPPEAPKKNTKNHNPSSQSVEVLQELKESLMPMMKQLSTGQKAGKKDSKKASDKENGKNSRAERAERRANSRTTSAAPSEDEEEVDVSDADAKAKRRLSAAAEDAVGAVSALETGDAASMAEVRKVLEEVCDAEPEARTNPSIQAAYVALDNMEAEETEAISAESALLYKEQQNLVREIAKSKHALKLAAVRLAWYDAAPDHVDKDEEVPGEDHVGGGKEALDELIERQDSEEANLARLRQELKANKAAIDGLQAEIPERVVSSSRLSQLKLVVKHQQAATDAMRFKQQARSAGGLVQEVLAAWEHAIPAELSTLLLEVFDLQGTAKPNASIDTQRRGTLETRRAADGEAIATPATRKVTRKARAAAARSEEDSPRDDGAVGDESDEEEDDDDDDEEHDPHVLDAGGVATPWRTLGSLAQKAAKGGAADDDDEEEEDDDNEEEEEAEAKEVMRKAQQELKDARGKRLSVMKFVEESFTPKPKKSGKAAGKKAAEKKQQEQAEESTGSAEGAKRVPLSDRTGSARNQKTGSARRADKAEELEKAKPRKASKGTRAAKAAAA